MSESDRWHLGVGNVILVVGGGGGEGVEVVSGLFVETRAGKGIWGFVWQTPLRVVV